MPIALLVCIGCSGSVDLDLSGQVTDAADGTPLAGVPVILLYHPGAYQLEAVGTETGSDGTFSLLLIQVSCDGAPTLTAGGDPFRTQEREIRCTSDPQQIDFALTR